MNETTLKSALTQPLTRRQLFERGAELGSKYGAEVVTAALIGTTAYVIWEHTGRKYEEAPMSVEAKSTSAPEDTK